MLFTRGATLPPVGSIQDRVMREMVFRERRDKVAQVETMAKIVGRLFNLDPDRAFGDVLAGFASEIFQETYDADMLRKKIEALRTAQQRIKNRRSEDLRQMSRLERLGEYYDREFGPDLKPVPKKK